MAEYIFTNLPQYIRVTPRTDFANSVVQANHVLLFSEDGSTLTGKLPDGSFITIGGSGGTDVSDTTATAADVLAGKDFHLANGTKATGTIQTVTASASGNVVTVPAGYIAAAQTLTVAEAGAASVSGNVVTIPVGYIASQRTVTVGTAVAAQTITPGTTDQTIAADSYLSGAATIKGDANLIAANIASGVTIFGVTGAAAGSTNFYKCATVDTVNQTWTGYKAVLSGGKYTYESTVTSNLTYGPSVQVPQVGKIYNDGATITVEKLWNGIPENGLVFYASLSAANAAAETGQTLSPKSVGNGISYQTYKNIKCVRLQDGSRIAVTSGLSSLPSGDSPWTIAAWCAPLNQPQDWGSGLFGYGVHSGTEEVYIWFSGTLEGSQKKIGVNVYQSGFYTGAQYTLGDWVHVACSYDGEVIRTFINGQPMATKLLSMNISQSNWLIGAMGDPDYSFDPFFGYIAGCRLYNRALAAAEIAALASEFTPSVS